MAIRQLIDEFQETIIETKFTKWNSKFDKEKILNLSKEGKNIREISKIIEIPEKRLAEMLNYYSIIIKKQFIYNVNDDFFDNIDSEIKAYLLGYIVADGWIAIENKNNGSKSYRIGVSVSIDDLEVVQFIKTNICPNNKILNQNNQSGVKFRKPQIVLKFSSKYMVNILIEKYSIIPNKTYNKEFKFPEITNFKRDFIRGFFDGDGSVRNTQVSFVSTSLDFLQSIVNEIRNNVKGISYIIYEEKGKTIDYYRLIINCGYGLKLKVYNYLYKDSTYFLSRKKEKFNIDNTELSSSITKGDEVA